MLPVSVVFPPVAADLADVAGRLREVVVDQGMTFRGPHWLQERSEAGSKAVCFQRGVAGEFPGGLDLTGVDGVSFPVQVKQDEAVSEWIASLTRQPRGCALRYITDITEDRIDVHEGWVIGLLARTLAVFDLPVAWLDLSDELVRVEQVDPDRLAARLVQPPFPRMLVSTDPPPAWLASALERAAPHTVLRVTTGFLAMLRSTDA